MLAPVLVALASVAGLARAADVNLVWNVGWVNDVNPDGLASRRAIGVNGTWPPPIIVSASLAF